MKSVQDVLREVANTEFDRPYNLEYARFSCNIVKDALLQNQFTETMASRFRHSLMNDFGAAISVWSPDGEAVLTQRELGDCRFMFLHLVAMVLDEEAVKE